MRLSHHSLPSINTQVGEGRPVAQPTRPLNPEAPAFRPGAFQPNPRPLNPNAVRFDPGAGSHLTNRQSLRPDARPFNPPEPTNYRPQAPVAQLPAFRPMYSQQPGSASSFASSPGGSPLANAPVMQNRRDQDMQGPSMNAFRPSAAGLGFPPSASTPAAGPFRPLPPAPNGYVALPHTSPTSAVPMASPDGRTPINPPPTYSAATDQPPAHSQNNPGFHTRFEPPPFTPQSTGTPVSPSTFS